MKITCFVFSQGHPLVLRLYIILKSPQNKRCILLLGDCMCVFCDGIIIVGCIDNFVDSASKTV